MAPRRAHKKSRTGCYTCKRRRVKCDEKGPPCGPCRSRAIECSFSPSNMSLVGAEIRKGDRPVVNTPVTLPGGFPAARSGTIPAPDAVSDKMLELELMHQWTATTYKCFCGEDIREYHTWQVIVPRDALRHAFLLDGILAISALEIAVFENPTNPIKYKQAALEYHGRVLSGFRSILTNVDANNAQAVFAASLFLMILGLAIPQFTTTGTFHSLIESITNHHELVRGAGLIAVEHKLQGGPLLQYADEHKQRPGRCLQDDVLAAFEHLNNVNEELHDRSDGQTLEAKLTAVTYHSACQKAILILGNLYRKCQEPLNRGLALAWLNFTGKEFVTAIEISDPVALLALMYWGVLCQQIGVGLWWAQSLGQRIAQQVIPTLPRRSSSALSAAVSWVQDQVGS